MALVARFTIAQIIMPLGFFVIIDGGFESHVNSYCPLCGIDCVAHSTDSDGTPIALDLDMTQLNYESRDCGREIRDSNRERHAARKTYNSCY